MSRKFWYFCAKREASFNSAKCIGIVSPLDVPTLITGETVDPRLCLLVHRHHHCISASLEWHVMLEVNNGCSV
jgi:hypothetical protein